MQKANPAQRRYIARFFTAMSGYVVVFFITTWMIRHWHPTGTALAALAVLPALPLLGVIAVLALYMIEERDEFLRQRLAVSMLIGLGALLAVLTVWGFLANSEVVPEPPTFLAFPAWCAFFGIANCGLTLRDRFGSRA